MALLTHTHQIQFTARYLHQTCLGSLHTMPCICLVKCSYWMYLLCDKSFVCLAFRVGVWSEGHNSWRLVSAAITVPDHLESPHTIWLAVSVVLSFAQGKSLLGEDYFEETTQTCARFWYVSVSSELLMVKRYWWYARLKSTWTMATLVYQTSFSYLTPCNYIQPYIK